MPVNSCDGDKVWSVYFLIPDYGENLTMLLLYNSAILKIQ